MARTQLPNKQLRPAVARTWKGNNTGSPSTPTDNAAGSLSETISSVLTITGGSNSLLNDILIQVKQASGSQSGFLSSTDWTTFNSKQAPLTNPVISSSASPSANNFAVFNATGTQVDPKTATQATALLNAMVGDSGSGGTKGLVPAPAAGDATKFLQGNGSFGSPVSIGTVALLPTNGSISSDWLPMDGQVVSQSSYTSLYNGIGIIDPSGSGTAWSPPSSTAATKVYTDMAYGNGVWVGVGASGVIETSTDLKSWIPRTSGTASNLRSVAFGNNIFVAVGASGVICYSIDNGSSWAATSSGTAQFNAVKYLNSEFIAVGNSGTIRASSNGSSWATVTSGISSTLNDIAYGNGKYIIAVAGTTPQNSLLISTDRSSWSNNAPKFPWANCLTIDFCNGYFVASCNTSSFASIISSTDGDTWYFRNLIAGSATYSNYGTGSNKYVISVNGKGVAYNVFYSRDGGDAWAASYVGQAFNMIGAVITENKYVVFGNSGAISTSSDCEAFIPVSSGTSNTLNVSAYGKGRLIIGGASGTLVVSDDEGASFSVLASSGTTDTITAMCYSPQLNLFFYGTNLGKIFTSTSGDSGSWTDVSAGAAGLGTPVIQTFAPTMGGVVSFTTSSNLLYTTANGSTFTSRTSNQSANVGGIATGNGVSIIRSSNSISWSQNSTAWNAVGLPSKVTGNDTNSLYFDPYRAKFMICQGGNMLTTKNGLTFEPAYDAFTVANTVSKIRSTGFGLLIGTTNGYIGFTKDGLSYTWSLSDGNTSKYPVSFGSDGGNNVVACMNYGLLDQKSSYDVTTQFRIPNATNYDSPSRVLTDQNSVTRFKYYIKAL